LNQESNDQENRLTAFPLSENELKERLKNSFFDEKSFEQPLTKCSLSKCLGMCCYDGVALLKNVATKHIKYYGKN
jgi:hypothetical protein